MTASGAGGGTTGPTILLFLTLLACARVDQFVTRCRLPLDSPVANEGMVCWDMCVAVPNAIQRFNCLRTCPGVEITPGEACQFDGRHPPGELCQTIVTEYRSYDAKRTREAIDAASAMIRVTASIAGAASGNHCRTRFHGR